MAEGLCLTCQLPYRTARDVPPAIASTNDRPLPRSITTPEESRTFLYSHEDRASAHATRTPIDGSPPVLLTRISNRVPVTSNRLAEESCNVIGETSAKQPNNTCCCTLTTTTLGAMRTPNVLRKMRPTLPSTNETHRQQFVVWSQLAPALVEHPL